MVEYVTCLDQRGPIINFSDFRFSISDFRPFIPMSLYVDVYDLDSKERIISIYKYMIANR